MHQLDSHACVCVCVCVGAGFLVSRNNYVDVLFAHFVFRVRIFYEREVLLQKAVLLYTPPTQSSFGQEEEPMVNVFASQPLGISPSLHFHTCLPGAVLRPSVKAMYVYLLMFAVCFFCLLVWRRRKLSCHVALYPDFMFTCFVLMVYQLD